ncbi:DUF2203 family protein [Bdellovibrionota bacterium]
MGKVYQLEIGKKFTLEEAQDLLPLVRRITKEAVISTEKIAMKISGYVGDTTRGREKLEKDFQEIAERWATKIFKLGAHVKGLWLVDFDNGEGFYSWRYPETDLRYHYNYGEGFAARLPLSRETTHSNDIQY